jgi:geranylgeranyl reductase family protein
MANTAGNKVSTYDVVIIGGGPAGCSAGIRLAQGGQKVAILETKKFPRVKLCGGLITQKTIDIIQNELEIDNIASVIEHSSNTFAIYDRTKLINKVATDRFTYCVSRFNFDNMLFSKAIDSGCDTYEEVKISRINTSDRHLSIGNIKFNYKYLLGAYGANNSVNKMLGMPLDKKLLAIGLQCDIPFNHFKNISDWGHPKIFFGHLKYGWGWTFPKRDYLTVGLAGLISDGSELRKRYLLFLKELGIDNDHGDVCIKGGIIPYGTFTKRPAKQGTFLLGDAAGFAEPITGEGIYYAIKSGLLAADTILSTRENKEETYIDLCGKHIINDLMQAKFSRVFLFNEPFHSIVISKLSKSTKHMVSFMRILSGEIDYKIFFSEIIKRKLGLTK